MQCGNRISDANFLIVFHSNYRPILLSFRDDHGMDDRWTTDGPISHLVPLVVHEFHC